MKENQRIMLSKRLLRESMLRLLENRSPEKITITELCEEAGINRGTFYRHYSTPRDVLEDICQELIRNMKKLYHTPDTREDAEECFVSIYEYMYRHADLIRILIRTHADREIAAAIGEIYRNICAERERITFLQAADDQTLQMTAAFLGGGSYYLIREWLLENIPKTPREIAALMFEILNFGRILP